MNKLKKTVKAIMAEVMYWTPIILVILVFTICAMMVGIMVGKKIWIILIADLAFFYLLWEILQTFDKNRYKMTLKKKILTLLSIILFLFIAFATLGGSMITDQRVMGNIFIFLIGVFTILGFYFSKKRNLN
jgi:hypothetical protein